jgi:hypothetical protein
MIVQRLLDKAVKDAFFTMEWQGQTSPDDAIEYDYNKSSDNVDWLVSDFVADFKAHIKNKTTVHFGIRPTISEGENFNLIAKYSIW